MLQVHACPVHLNGAATLHHAAALQQHRQPDVDTWEDRVIPSLACHLMSEFSQTLALPQLICFRSRQAME